MLYYFIFVSFLFGAVIGSFINCFVWRLHEDETLWNRSYCPKCRKMIAWFDNIPIISFFILKGHCRRCEKKISWQYPLVELSTACLFALSFFLLAMKYLAGNDWLVDSYILGGSQFVLDLARSWLIIFVLTAIFIYDARWYLIPDKVVLPGALLVFGLDLFLGYDWLILLFCVLIGGGFFLLQFLISQGKWIGGGDIRLGIFIGCAAGQYSKLLLAILLTYCLGSIIGVLLVIFGKKEWTSKVPLAVFAAPALLVTLFWGQSIIAWYIGLF
jgi:leader peptidase (prepilin peptidase) / N-methyltransferase